MSNNSTDGGAEARLRLILYGGTIFVSSAILLVLEIAAGRLIAPYVGVSLYSWTSVIGVILAGLSIGNWVGGIVADRGASHGTAALALAASALASLAVLLALTLVAPLVLASSMSLLGSSFVLVAALFFLPALMLGVITPLLTTLALNLDPRAGRVVGTMHALAALGSITGTFLAGYWLIQTFGTRSVLLGCAAVLLALAVPFISRRDGVSVAGAVVLTVVVLGATSVRQGFADPCHAESAYYCIRVEDASPEVPFGTARVLVLDHLVHGMNHESEPGMLVSPYVHLADEMILGHLGGDAAATAKYLFVGGGAYTHPRSVRELSPAAEVTIIEIDPQVTAAAEESLWFKRVGARVIHTDARVALNRLGAERFDVVIGDVAQDIAMPYHLLTSEYAALVKSRLTADGLYVLNLVDAHPDPRLVKAVVKTLRGHFRHVHVWLEGLPPGAQRDTFLISATDSGEPPRSLASQRGFERNWHRMTSTVLATGTSLDEIPVLTDDFVPVERLVARLLTTELGR